MSNNKKTFLVIENNLEYSNDLKDYLESKGFNVIIKDRIDEECFNLVGLYEDRFLKPTKEGAKVAGVFCDFALNENTNGLTGFIRPICRLGKDFQATMPPILGISMDGSSYQSGMYNAFESPFGCYIGGLYRDVKGRENWAQQTVDKFMEHPRFLGVPSAQMAQSYQESCYEFYDEIDDSKIGKGQQPTRPFF